MKEYSLYLSENEVNLVLNTLAQQPYYVVAELIEKIRHQCEGGAVQ